jgi:hypothetical protein
LSRGKRGPLPAVRNPPHGGRPRGSERDSRFSTTRRWGQAAVHPIGCRLRAASTDARRARHSRNGNRAQRPRARGHCFVVAAPANVPEDAANGTLRSARSVPRRRHVICVLQPSLTFQAIAFSSRSSRRKAHAIRKNRSHRCRGSHVGRLTGHVICQRSKAVGGHLIRADTRSGRTLSQHIL